MDTIKTIGDYKIEKVHSKEDFDKETQNDKYKKILDGSGYLTDKGLNYRILTKESKTIGFIILDEYRHSEESLIAYMRLYEPVPVDDKKEIIKTAIAFAKRQRHHSLYFRAQEEDHLLNEALCDLGFEISGNFITNATGEGFSYYKVYKYSLEE